MSCNLAGFPGARGTGGNVPHSRVCLHARRRRLDRASAACERRARAARRDLGAALISAAITVTILAVLLLVFSEPARLSGLAGFKPHHAIGGIGGAAVVAVSLVAVRPLGVAGVGVAAGRRSAGDLGRPTGWGGSALRRSD